MFYIDLIYGKKRLLVLNKKAYSLDIKYVTSFSRPVPSLFKLCPWGQKTAGPGVHMFYKGISWENLKKILSGSSKPRGLVFGM